MKRECKDHLGNVYSSAMDMCKFYRISYDAYRKRCKNNWDLKRILTTPVKYVEKKRHFDHLGQEFNTIREMCEFWNIDTKTFEARRKNGWSVKDALTKAVKIHKSCFDHLGNEYDTIKDMCNEYNIPSETYYSRIRKGWSKEKALTTDKKDCKKYIDHQGKKYIDHQGNQFNTLKEMCNFWGVKNSTYISRIKKNWSIEDALTTDTKKVSSYKDHLGNEYDSLSSMCNTYNISLVGYKHREKLGLTLEEILTMPSIGKICYDHLGNRYFSIEEMCNTYDIPYKTYNRRINNGKTVEEALTNPLKKNKCYDHLGNVYKNKSEMCKTYGINLHLYNERLRKKWSKEKALCTPISNNRGQKIVDHLGITYDSIVQICGAYHIPVSLFSGRIRNNWTIEEALTIPRNMYIGEYRVAECLKKLKVKFYHDCTIKKCFSDLNIDIDWNDFLSELQCNLLKANIKWSKGKIEKLRPDFVLYTDDDNTIKGVIEFDGEQHQNFVEYFFKTIEQFIYRCNIDSAKTSLWEYLNIPMLRIRHDQVDRIDYMVKDFINNPQNYIYNHNTYLTENEYWSILNEEKKKLDLAFTY